MKVTVLDDYQNALGSTAPIQRLREKAEVQILTEKVESEDALARAAADSKALIPIRERTKFSAVLMWSVIWPALPDEAPCPMLLAPSLMAALTLSEASDGPP